MKRSCKALLCTVIDDATQRFSDSFDVIAAYKDAFLGYADALDVFTMEFDGRVVSACVDNMTQCIGVHIEVSDVVIREKSHGFYSLVKCALTASFAHLDDDAVEITLVFPSIWKPVEM